MSTSLFLIGLCHNHCSLFPLLFLSSHNILFYYVLFYPILLFLIYKTCYLFFKLFPLKYHFSSATGFWSRWQWQNEASIGFKQSHCHWRNNWSWALLMWTDWLGLQCLVSLCGLSSAHSRSLLSVATALPPSHFTVIDGCRLSPLVQPLW